LRVCVCARVSERVYACVRERVSVRERVGVRFVWVCVNGCVFVFVFCVCMCTRAQYFTHMKQNLIHIWNKTLWNYINMIYTK
jgi:hypothetical protein